jgi:hypothetical protein
MWLEKLHKTLGLKLNLSTVDVEQFSAEQAGIWKTKEYFTYARKKKRSCNYVTICMKHTARLWIN